MDKKVKRAFEKAMNYYERGEINKALDICEDILLEGLDNSNVLNFKGLLLYQKGSLDDAITVWKMNRDLNNDNISKNYIKDSFADEKKIELFKQGEQALKQLKVDKALGLFMKCAESDFNAIKVNTGIAMCYQKKGDFYRAKEYVSKALKIDRHAITAKSIQKELKENGIEIENRHPSKNILIGVIILFVILAIVLGGYSVISKYKNRTPSNIVEEAKNDESYARSEKINESEIERSTEPNLDSQQQIDDTSKKSALNKEKLTALINSNDLDGIYEQLKDVKKETLDSGDLEVYKNAVDLMKNQGISQFYETGLKSFNENNYAAAKVSLDKAYAYCEGSSLKEHILFYRASSASKLPNKSTAIVEYEEYYKQYPKGVYTQEALYDLSLLADSIDSEKSKNYANILINNYPDSIYVNDIIKGIANR